MLAEWKTADGQSSVHEEWATEREPTRALDASTHFFHAVHVQYKCRRPIYICTSRANTYLGQVISEDSNTLSGPHHIQM